MAESSAFWWIPFGINFILYGGCCFLILKRKNLSMISVRSPTLLLGTILGNFLMSLVIIISQMIGTENNGSKFITSFYYLFRLMMIVSIFLRNERIILCCGINTNDTTDMKQFYDKRYLFVEKFYVRIFAGFLAAFFIGTIVILIIQKPYLEIFYINRETEINIAKTWIWIIWNFLEEFILLTYLFRLYDIISPKQFVKFELYSYLIVWAFYNNFSLIFYFYVKDDDLQTTLDIVSLAILYTCLILDGIMPVVMSFITSKTLLNYHFTFKLMNNLYLFLTDETCYKSFNNYLINKYNESKVNKDMNKIKAFLLMTLMMVSSAVMAQTTVKGVLMDKSSNEGEAFATVRVFKAGQKTKAVAMFLIDAEGRFSHEVKGTGDYDVVFSSVGKNDQKQAIKLKDSGVVDLGTVYMEANAQMLKDVEVVAQKPLVKMEVDKISYNVADDEDSKSNTVLDMLRKVPMVTVDGQDNISVNGSSSFKVYVDGMPNVMFSSNPSMVFKSMPASAVKSIEVVTNPGAKYDAEGAAGVLNIVMNRMDPMAAQSMNGYNGTLSASAGNKSLGGSAFISGQQGKLSYSANVMTNYSKPGTTKTEMEQIQDNGGSQLMTSGNDVKIPFTMGSLTLGYQLSENSTINATAQVNSMSMKSTGTTATTMNGGIYGNGFSYGSTTDMKNSRTSFSGSLDFQHFFNKEHTQSLALTYQLNYSPATTEMTNNFGSSSTIIDLTNRNSENKDKTTNRTFQLDYTMSLGIGQTLSLGSKLLLHDATSDAKYFLKGEYEPGASSEYEYKNSVLAGYGEYAGNFNKFGLKAGLRYEHTWQDVKYHLGNGHDFSTSYGSLVPTASLQYTITQGSNLGLSYNMRISRPGISYLNPYMDKTNPIALTYGNPDLDVEKAHNVSLVYNTFTQKLMFNLNLHHNIVDNAISQYSFYDSNNLLNTTYGNVGKSHQTGLSAYVNYLFTKDTRLFLNGGLNYTNLRSTALDQRNSGWTANAMVGLQQTLPWDLKLGAFAITSTKSYSLQGWNGGFNLITANLSKTLLKDKLTSKDDADRSGSGIGIENTRRRLELMYHDRYQWEQSLSGDIYHVKIILNS